MAYIHEHIFISYRFKIFPFSAELFVCFFNNLKLSHLTHFRFHFLTMRVVPMYHETIMVIHLFKFVHTLGSRCNISILKFIMSTLRNDAMLKNCLANCEVFIIYKTFYQTDIMNTIPNTGI